MKSVLIPFFSFILASSFAVADTTQSSDKSSDNHSGSSGDSPRYEVSFEQLDADSNGVISEAEAAASGIDSQAFQRLDKNADGELSREELLGVSRNEDEAPGNYNPGNSSNQDVDRGTEQRSNEMSPADRSIQ
ncbi:MAG: hypothetical protein M0P11_08100 [Anaerolineaceae bacterium]|nr:hypothetical protein [Anaerolineaceae bacterium]